MKEKIYRSIRGVLIKILLVLESLFLIRIIFAFFNANENAWAVRYLVYLTNILLVPFKGIFPLISFSKFGLTGVIDTVAITGVATYAICFLIIISVLSLFIEE